MTSCAIRRIALVTLPVLALACSTKNEEGGTGTETDTGTGTETGSGDGGDGSDGGDTDDGSGGTGGDDGGDDGGDTPCVPGQSVPCACPDGSTGAQVCADDGQSFGPCECEGGDDGSGDDGGTTDTGGTGGSCEDPGPEPNEDEANAVAKPEAGCDGDTGSIVGVLNEDQDADWFSYHGVWTCGTADALPAVTLQAADGTLRLCVFAECDQGEADVECQNGDPATSPAGFPGCCTEPDGDVLGQLNCTTTEDESALVYVRVDQGGAGVCTGYTLGYSF